MHERKTNTNLFWQVKFICFHLISATSIDKTAQLLMDNRQDLHFDNEYNIFAIKRFQLKLVKSFPIPLCVSTTDTLCHGNIVRFYRTELCKQGTSDNATTESDYIVFILQRNGSISTTSRHGNHHTFTQFSHWGCCGGLWCIYYHSFLWWPWRRSYFLSLEIHLVKKWKYFQ